VTHRRHNRLVAATLLIAALAAYVDLPRLYQAGSIGDTLNAVRVFDAIQHSRMFQRALDAGIADTDLQDGQESLELVLQVAPVPSFIAPTFNFAKPVLQPAPKLGETEFQPLTGLAGALFKLDLPPPRLEALWQPPRLQSPSFGRPALRSRAPPFLW
jgi:hypothetical protein